MNTDVKEVRQTIANILYKGESVLDNIMETIAKAYAPVPENEIMNKVEEIILAPNAMSEDNANHKARAICSLFQQTYTAAPVPGKEEMIKRLAELKPYHIMPYNLGDSGEIARIIDALAASPSTASNEDKHDMGVYENYVRETTVGENEMTPFGATLKDMSMGNAKTILNEPKAVQQAAEDFASEIVAIPEERWDNFHQKEWEKVKSYFLAGASFNSKDAVEFGDWIGLHCDYVVQQFEDSRKDLWGWECDIHKGLFTTQELYNLYLDSIKQIKQ